MHQNNNVTIARVNSNQACAACKYQRRKCPPDCILAPYFPHDRPRQFLNAHKLFGVSNITKIIRHLNQPEKDAAMRTIIFQSDVRANDPVGGCYRIVRQLQRQIDYAKAELEIVMHQLALCKAQVQAAARLQQHQHIILPPHDHHATTDSTANYDIFCLDDAMGSNEPQQISVYQDQEPDVSLQEISDSWGMRGGSICSPHVINPIEKLPSPPRECNSTDFKPLDFTNHPRVDFKQSGEANLTAKKTTLEEDEEAFQCARDHDFKDGASLFTLSKSSSTC